MRLSDFGTLTFDCYGTLIDWESGIVNELRPWVTRHGLELSDDALLEAFAVQESRHQAATPDKPYPELLASLHRDLAAQWGLPAEEDAAAAFGQSVGRWPAFPDSAPSLQYLKRHYRLVVLSNVDRASFARSNERLSVAFDAVVTAEDVGSYKPDPRNFARLLETLAAMGVKRDTVLHTAQSLFHDIVPAKAAGLATLWINRRKGRPGGGATPPVDASVRSDFEVASLAEFVDRHRAEAGGGA